ncbi:MAG: cobalamin-dependent protein [Chloroflexi bacterium]|nr:cobalamin-dependent protein [Chloroflexota bacterium]
MPPTPKISTAREAIARHVRGEMILPDVLRAFEEVGRGGAEVKEPRGTVVVATLPGDVHHIGTALLYTVLDSAGYAVHDLGMQVPIQTIIEAAARLNADAIALSALLVTSSRQMPVCIQALDQRGLQIPVLVGGAAINRAFGRRSGVLPDGRVYAAGVFYCRDVFEGLAALDALTDPAQRQNAIDEVRAEIAAERDQAPQSSPRPRSAAMQARRAVEVPVPPYWGARRRQVDLHEVWQSLDRNTLFRFHWGGYRASDADFPEIVRRQFEPWFDRLTQDALREGWLEARVVGGYFACRAEGDALHFLDADVRLDFPRQSDGERLCLADYFNNTRDVVALQAVTVGPRPGEYIQQLQRDGQYVKMLLVNGLASATAEALADYGHQLARRDLGLSPERGLRYSWGYAACPDLADQRKVLPLLDAEAGIGLTLTESDTLSPEHSTVAIVVHHPDATYFAVR